MPTHPGNGNSGARGSAVALPGLKGALDEERAASMADEGGRSGQVMETEVHRAPIPVVDLQGRPLPRAVWIGGAALVGGTLVAAGLWWWSRRR